MPVDKDKMKALALAATPELGAIPFTAADTRFMIECGPATVLELLAENDNLRAGLIDTSNDPAIGTPAGLGNYAKGYAAGRKKAKADIDKLNQERDELRAEVERLRARFEYIEDNATTHGGGRGFTVSFFVPEDSEDIGCGIDAAIAAHSKAGKQ